MSSFDIVTEQRILVAEVELSVVDHGIRPTDPLDLGRLEPRDLDRGSETACGRFALDRLRAAAPL